MDKLRNLLAISARLRNARPLLTLSLALAAMVAFVGATILIKTPLRVQAGNGDGDSEQSKIRIGFEIAPVPLNMDGKNPALVGLGSYIVNQDGCNDCHSAGPPTQFAHGGNPYFGQEPAVVNQATYLGGGRVFPLLVPGSAPIVSRNLTPDRTGLPEGGRTFGEFVLIMRTGVDLDHLHPTCPVGTVNSSCIPAPFDGNLLQIMPWPNFKNMTDHDLKAVYEYLKAVPCISGPPAPSPLHNDC